RRRLCRCRRDPGDGVRHPLRDPVCKDRLPLQPGRARRLRHGGMRHPAAHRRPGACRRAPLHRPLARRRGGRALGVSQPAVRAGPLAEAAELAAPLARGPTFANGLTKRMLEMEWAMSVPAAIEAEAVAQALAMTTQDFRRAYEAFSEKRKPVFEGN